MYLHAFIEGCSRNADWEWQQPLGPGVEAFPQASSWCYVVVADQLLCRDAKYHLHARIDRSMMAWCKSINDTRSAYKSINDTRRPRSITLEVAVLTSTSGRSSHERSSSRALRCTSWSSTRRRASGPKRRSTRFLMWRWSGPSMETMLLAPKTRTKEEGYQIWKPRSSSCSTRAFSSGSSDTIRSSPTMFVRKMGPNLHATSQRRRRSAGTYLIRCWWLTYIKLS